MFLSCSEISSAIFSNEYDMICVLFTFDCNEHTDGNLGLSADTGEQKRVYSKAFNLKLRLCDLRVKKIKFALQETCEYCWRASVRYT